MDRHQCRERRGDLICTQTYPHPGHSHDFWPMSDADKDQWDREMAGRCRVCGALGSEAIVAPEDRAVQ